MKFCKMFLNSNVCFLLYVISVLKKWKVNCYIFLMILQKKKNIAIRNSFRFFITVLQKKKRKENDTLKIRLEFFPQIWLSEYANWDRLALSPLIWVSGVRRLVLIPLIWVSGVRSLLCLMCVNEQSVLYMLGVFHRF